jgi:putative oxidoreductase
MKLGILMLRATIGGAFVGHGAQKLFGVQGGHGLKGTAGFFEGLGLKPGIVHATAAGVAEIGGGAGLLLGYRTPLAASAVVATMTTAIQRVHGKNGWDTQQGGYEYNAVLIAGAVAIATEGPGVLSLDALRGKQRSGVVPGLFALLAGLAGAAGSSAVAGYFGGETAPAPEPTPEPVTAAAAEAEAAEAPLPVEPLGN